MGQHRVNKGMKKGESRRCEVREIMGQGKDQIDHSNDFNQVKKTHTSTALLRDI